jgi:HTH-type transcriptional regulator/antitoxin HigA
MQENSTVTVRRPAELFPPGEFLAEELHERGWSQTDLAAILHCPLRTVNEVVNSKRGISPELAYGLGAALGTSPELWMNLDASYRLARVASTASDDIARRARLYNKAPVREMIRRGWIDATDDPERCERLVLDFLEIDDLDHEPCFEFAAGKSTPFDCATPAQVAWVARARQLARTISVAPWDPIALSTAFGQIRDFLSAPERIHLVPRVLGDFGIRLIAVEQLTGSRIDGACVWDGGAPVIALSLRHDRIDSFWFTLLHELGHVCNGERSLDVDLETSGGQSTYEDAASRFATDYLIASSEFDTFVADNAPRIMAGAINAFARSVGVHPGIVVGRLQHRGIVPRSQFSTMLEPVRCRIVPSPGSDGFSSARS